MKGEKERSCSYMTALDHLLITKWGVFANFLEVKFPENPHLSMTVSKSTNFLQTLLRENFVIIRPSAFFQCQVNLKYVLRRCLSKLRVIKSSFYALCQLTQLQLTNSNSKQKQN